MQINMAVEPLVREAFDAAVAYNTDLSVTAIQAIVDRGDADFDASLNLAAAVVTFALFDIHGGERPDDDQLRELAQSFVEANEWSGFDEETTVTFLAELADGTSVETLSQEAVGRLVFAMGGWLLETFHPDEQTWHTYLDEILKALESAP